MSLARRAFLAVLCLCATLFARDWALGLPVGYLPLVTLSALAGFLSVKRWPLLRVWLAVLLGAATLAAVGHRAVADGMAAPPASVFLMLIAALLVLVANAWVGLGLAVAALLQWALLVRQFPPPSEREVRLLENLFMLTPSLLATAWFFQRAFGRLGQDLDQRSRELARHDGQNRALGHQVFDGFAAPLQDMAEALEQPQAQPSRLSDAFERLNAGVQAARAAARRDERLESPADDDPFLSARFSYLRVSVWFIVAVMLIPVVGSALRGHVNPLTYMNAAVALSLAAFGLLGLKPDRARAAAWALLVPTLLETVPGLRFWAPPGQAPGLIAMPAMVLLAAFWDGWAMALTAGIACAAMIALDASWSMDAPLRLQQDFDAMAATLMALFTAGQALDLHRALIRHRHGVLERLKQGLASRRRLLGVLFHDLANPLSVISLGLEPGEPLDRAGLLAQVRRLQGLLQASRPFVLEGAGAAPDARCQSVELQPLLDGLQALFQHRLQAKRQALSLECPAGLAVSSVPELLGGSVLANLLSNAIKFTPAGGTIHVQALAVAGEVELRVRDQGPGFPSDMLRDWAQGRDLSSRAGSAGEPGQGLGLGLARDYLSRLGGSLALDNAPQGGAQARLRLPLAPIKAP